MQRTGSSVFTPSDSRVREKRAAGEGPGEAGARGAARFQSGNSAALVFDQSAYGISDTITSHSYAV